MNSENKKLYLLLGALALFFAGYLLWTMLFSPILTTIDAEQKTLVSEQKKLEGYEKERENLQNLADRLTAKSVELTSETSGFLPDLDTDKIQYFITANAQAQGNQPYQITFDSETIIGSMTSDTWETPSGTSSKSSSSDTAQEATPDNVDIFSPIDYNLNVRSMMVEIKFSDISTAQLLGFMQTVENTGRTVFLSEFNTKENSVNPSAMDATLKYQFISLDKVTTADTGLEAVPNASPTGKADLFN